MRQVHFEEFRAAAGLTAENIKRLRARRHLALAFGRAEAFAGLGYVELDAVGVALTTALNARGIERTFAAQVVRVHWPTWARAVAMAEARFADDPVFFAVLEFTRRGAPASRCHVAAAGPFFAANEIAGAAAEVVDPAVWQPARSTAANVTEVLLTVRENAAGAGFDWLDRFLPPPDDPRLADLLRPHEDALGRAIVEVRQQRAREKLAARAGTMARKQFESTLQ